MLTDKQKEAIEAEIDRYPNREAVSIEAMKQVQAADGWVSDEAIVDLADYLGMTPAELDGVATFYNLIYRRPVGRHVIHVCDSVSCWIMGYEQVQQQLEAKLNIEMGQTTADGRFTLLPIPCLGCCDHAPALMIDEDLHEDISPDGVQAILEQYPRTDYGLRTTDYAPRRKKWNGR
ncbi:MAG: NADH-quinone oxidoreductase subunit NuoE [Ardenticatenaceae bacterium]|nr:NADH-quinone oxidoreductase subunit NuoE [Ardenticatenaceae bacterium]MCB9445337.1 NADH-quinone oxidoreductase subunit NuoE [Ardenticatenaceae bacterium]